MLTRSLTARHQSEQGFTLIEVLVVMIIIGILASIAVPVLLSQRGKARDAATRADVSTVGIEMMTYYVDGTGLPPTVALVGRTLTLDGAFIGNASNGTALGNQNGTDATTWCFALTNPDGKDRDYRFSAQGGLAKGAC